MAVSLGGSCRGGSRSITLLVEQVETKSLEIPFAWLLHVRSKSIVWTEGEKSQFGSSGGRSPRPQKLTKVTLLTLILYKSENSICGTRPFCRPLFCHSSLVKYTSSRLQQWAVTRLDCQILLKLPPLTLLAGSTPEESQMCFSGRCASFSRGPDRVFSFRSYFVRSALSLQFCVLFADLLSHWCCSGVKCYRLPLASVRLETYGGNLHCACCLPGASVTYASFGVYAPLERYVFCKLQPMQLPFSTVAEIPNISGMVGEWLLILVLLR